MKWKCFFNKSVESSTFIVPHKHNKNAEDFLFNRSSRFYFIKNKAGGFAVLCLCLCGNFHSPGLLYTFSNPSFTHKSYHMEIPTLEVSKQRLNRIYNGMLDRCLNPKNPNFKNYGGRGITVCIEWIRSREAFIDWALKSNYWSNLSIDRIDNNAGYTPDNCRWATAVQQALNRRNTIRVTYIGYTKSLIEWCDILKLDYNKVHKNIKDGIAIEDALNPETYKAPITYLHNGEEITANERAELLQQYKRILDQAYNFQEFYAQPHVKQEKIKRLAKEINEKLCFFEANDIADRFEKIKNTDKAA